MFAIPADRLYPWAEYCGIPGGIPVRSTVYATITPASTLSQINAAISGCPSGQVVAFSAGDIDHDISLGAKKNITLLGAGPDLTVINGTISSDASSSFDWTGGDIIASGYTKGSMTIVIYGSGSLPGGYAVGNIILIDQEDDAAMVYHRTGNWAGTRNLRHVTRITGINGRTVSLATPLPWTYSGGLDPRCEVMAAGGSMLGIENMTINGDRCVGFRGAERCWLKDVGLTGFGNEAVFAQNSCQLELQRCYIHDAAGFPNQSDGYGLYTQYAVSCLKMEDCIGYKMAYMTVLNGNDSSAYLNNFAWHMGRAGFAWQNPGFNCNHGPHSMMNLWEGNMAERWQNDSYHGSASHQTLFRNHIHGKHPSYTLDRRIMDFCRVSYYFNAVGNVVGDSSWNPSYYQASKQTGAGYYTGSLDRSQGYLWVLGYPNMGSGSLTEETDLAGFTPPGGAYPDADVLSRMIRHANYDFYNDAAIYSDPDHEIPDSLFYSSKPDYFGNLMWPPIGPDVDNLVNDTPAKWRWDNYVLSGDLTNLFADVTAPENDRAEITGGGVLVAVGKKTGSGVGVISGGGLCVGVGKKQGVGDGDISGGGSVVAIGEQDVIGSYFGVGSISGGGIVSAEGWRSAVSVAIISANGLVLATGEKKALGSATISGGGLIEALAAAGGELEIFSGLCLDVEMQSKMDRSIEFSSEFTKEVVLNSRIDRDELNVE